MQQTSARRCGLSLVLMTAMIFPHAGARAAEPYLPASEAVVLERLPWRADADTRRLSGLRKAVSERPGDVTAALALAKHTFLLALAHGDARWAGMGEAALKPWWETPHATVDVLYYRALLKQYRHEFDAALADLALAAAADPKRADVWSWRVAVHLVRADINAAVADCDKMALGGNIGDLRECRAWIDGVSGNARRAYEEFTRILAAEPKGSVGTRRWLLLQLADNASRLGRKVEAEMHLRAAFAVAGADHATLIALADLLLDEGRYREVEALLLPRYQSDSALLRRALARKKLRDPRWKDDATRLDERYAAARLRGETLRENDEARLRLELLDQPAAALALAQSNWGVQRETVDARVLLEAALAAGRPKAAAPVLQWLERTRIEEPRLIELARKLRAQG